MSVAIHPELDTFARKNALDGLTEPSLRAIAEGREGYTIERARRFLEFQARIDRELLKHPIITDNAYTAWFEHGKQSHEQVMSFIVQFSVFSNQFLVAQLQKTLNADTLEGMRASKEILANEIGVVFNSPDKSKDKTQAVDSEHRADPRKAVSTAACSASARRTSNGCCASPRSSASSSRTWAGVFTGPSPRCSSATS